MVKSNKRKIQENQTENKENFSGKKKTKITKITDNPWAVSTIILSVLLIIAVIILVTPNNVEVGQASINSVDKESAGKSVIDFTNANVDDGISLVNVSDYNDYLYEVILSFEGQNLPVHVTKDGKTLITAMIPLDQIPEVKQQTQQPTQTSYSPEDIQQLSAFSECLAGKGVVIYGANWCGYTNAWVNTLGGYNTVSPIYVECTEQQAVCSEQEITGYPTTKINGVQYSGARTIEAIASATGCPVPVLMQELSSTTQTGSC